MHQRTTSRQTRSAFTLVELMVVILIISVLSALLLMAVSRGIAAAKRTRNMVEIRNLAASVDAFKTYYKVEYIPSRLYLSETGSYNLSFASTQSDSFAYLQRLWPKLTLPSTPTAGWVNWTGSGSGNVTMTLEGDQVLVFFLGGIVVPDPVTGVPSCTGFSTNPSNPSAHLKTGGAVAKPPLYEFDSSRLVLFQHGGSQPKVMYSYLDTYGTTDGKGGYVSGTPYAYFSNYGIRNGYNKYASTGVSDCSTLGVWPYAQGFTTALGGQYLNPSGFQIISAGVDGKFGPGSSSLTAPFFWTPATAAGSSASGPNGADDQSNFYDNLLGTSSVN